MIRIDPHTFYSHEELKDLLEGVVSLERFLRTVKPKKRPFKNVFWGGHLIEALNKCDVDMSGDLARSFGREEKKSANKKPSAKRTRKKPQSKPEEKVSGSIYAKGAFQ